MAPLRSGNHRGLMFVPVLIAALGLASFLHGCKRPTPPIVPPASQPATTQSSFSGLAATRMRSAPRTLLDVIRFDDPHYPTTQELDFPGDYDQAAHIILHEPVYLGPAGHLWITHPDALPAMQLLKNLGNENSHAARERILYAHWQSTQANPIVNLICTDAANHVHLAQAAKDIPLNLSHTFHWNRAVSLANFIVAPWDRGVTAINVNDPSHPLDQDLTDPAASPTAKLSSPIILFDKEGVIAWMPWENGLTGSRGAARFVDGKWTRLDSTNGWPDKILQLVPLLDGSILQLLPGDDGAIQLAMSGIDKPISPNDEQRVRQLVAGLSDPDQTNRDAAYEQLTRFGPGIFPLLQELHDSASPAAQSRIDELLHSKLKLTLGPITLNDGPVITAARLADGGVVLYCEAGVSIAIGSDDKPHIMTPAWLSIRPGYPIQVLPATFTRDLQPQKQKLFASQSEWIVGDDASGLRWFAGNHLQPLQHRSEFQFSDFVGIDAHGRWIMKTPNSSGPTLIVDPNLPDVSPSLPAWEFTAAGGATGWTTTNWPAAKKPGVFVLDATGWRDPAPNEKFFSKSADMPAPPPTSAPSTTQSTDASDLILIDKDGTRYFDGSKTLRIARPNAPPNGPTITWPLPPSAAGTGDVWLFHAGNDRFFLFNQPGRVLRLRRTPDSAKPFELEATFTRHIPNTNPERIWLDPAGRIDIAYGGDKLVILFPTGRIPPEIQQLMPADPDQP